ncbi:type IV pilus biogenesis/stability protein PilW [Zoogloea dura]|jgi:type IV pilus assembly protein PilF|uniref:Type IV pilus biogenesis/stability protein PilW n=1 Tax=Zoogloea dura TaxID=2728840 RepID=A0A848FWH7_9RHOO|nr:type IV pilus biogenesis/stability protein PilW [Zoogloea dura]NML24158.1 type IV pilus biogenesis/stability protein PilW [Zoogloea dura]
MLKSFLPAFVASLVLAGCASGPNLSGIDTRLERPVSEMPVQTDARRKAKVHVELGQAYFQAGRFGVALDEARAAAGYDSGYAPAYQLMGQVHMYLEENPVAEASFEHARRLAPGDPEIMNSYGWFLCSTGKERAGLALLTTAVRNPYYQTPARALTNIGLCHLRLKDDAAAEPYFIRALEADDTNLPAIYHLASITYRRGAYEAARRYVAALHKLGEPTAESLWLGIRIERRLGDRAAEATLVQQLRRRFPASPEFQAFQQGQYQ